MSLVVAIHQPNFYPWLGYFDKIRQSDFFVFLDDVQVIKTGGSWFNRVMIPNRESTAGKWLTVPIQRRPGTQLISAVEIADVTESISRFTNALRDRYSGAPFFRDTMELIHIPKDSETANLSQINANRVQMISKEIGLSRCKFVSSSDLKCALSSTSKLLEITRQLGANTYLCGGGADQYFDESLFTEAGKNVRYQQYRPVPYQQRGAPAFLPGMSIIDLLMNAGLEGAREYFASDLVGPTP
jgi:hypothetical protein